MLTRHNAEHIERTVREPYLGNTILPGYKVSGYRVEFVYYDDGWHISAGCRNWDTFKEMRSHYNRHWRKMDDPMWDDNLGLPMVDGSARRKTRAKNLKVYKKLKRFAKKHGIKVGSK